MPKSGDLVGGCVRTPRGEGLEPRQESRPPHDGAPQGRVRNWTTKA